MSRLHYDIVTSIFPDSYLKWTPISVSKLFMSAYAESLHCPDIALGIFSDSLGKRLLISVHHVFMNLVITWL